MARRRLITGHARSRTTASCRCRRAAASGLAACDLHRVEESFPFEIFGRDGKMRSRPRRQLRHRALTFYRCCRMGPPETTTLGISLPDRLLATRVREFPGGDRGGACPANRRCPCRSRDHRAIYEGDRDMIIMRSPLRITLGGGGTDLAVLLPRARLSDARRSTSTSTSAASRPFKPRHLSSNIRRSSTSISSTGPASDHPRSAATVPWRAARIEITTLADIPAGTGLGSRAASPRRCCARLHAYAANMIHPATGRAGLPHRNRSCSGSRSASRTSISRPIGGITCFNFRKDGTVEAAAGDVTRKPATSSTTTF